MNEVLRSLWVRGFRAHGDNKASGKAIATTLGKLIVAGDAEKSTEDLASKAGTDSAPPVTLFHLLASAGKCFCRGCWRKGRNRCGLASRQHPPRSTPLMSATSHLLAVDVFQSLLVPSSPT